jgi:pyrimidine deaminase RibD-like protein
VIRSEQLEWLILGYGLEIPHLGEQGRTTSVGQLLVLATEKCGDCNTDAVTDALFSLQPDHAELKKYVNNGPETQVFPFDRNDPKWREFFHSYFNISVLPAGRKRFETLSEQLVQVDDRKFAQMAIDEARKSTSEPDGRPHPFVGAVVVKNGQVLSVAHRGEAAGNHAEFIALEKKLSDQAVAGATAYTTLEPCTTRNHPKIPCAERLIERRVARVVIGMLDPDPRITGRGQIRLREAGIITDFFPHDLMTQAEELNREFTRFCKQIHTPQKKLTVQFFNFGGTKGPISVSGRQQSVQDSSLVDLWGLVTIVNYTPLPMKIAPLQLFLNGGEWPVNRIFFRLKSNPLPRFERISLLGNDKEDYEMHFMFSVSDCPQTRSGYLLIETDSGEELFRVDVKFP